jgi:DNA topoisomerase-1
VLAALALCTFEAPNSQAAGKRNIVKAIEEVADRLGNTKTVCRRCYVHPLIVESYLDGTLGRFLGSKGRPQPYHSRYWSAPEAAVLALLQQRLEKDTREVARRTA